MEIEKNDMVMVYDGGGTVPHCKYTGRFGDLTAYWQEIVSDAVYLFRLGESEQLPFTPSDFRIIDRTLTFRQLTDEIRKSLKQQAIEDKITFLEQMAQLNGGKL